MGRMSRLGSSWGVGVGGWNPFLVRERRLERSYIEGFGGHSIPVVSGGVWS